MIYDPEADEIERRNHPKDGFYTSNPFEIEMVSCKSREKTFKAEMSEFKFMKYFQPYKDSEEYKMIMSILNRHK